MRFEFGLRSAAAAARPPRRAFAWGVAASAAAFVGIEAMLFTGDDLPTRAARLTPTERLLARVAEDPSAEAATQELYDRVRSGTLDDATLLAAARAMWSARVAVDASAIAGGPLNVSVSLEPPRIVGDLPDRAARCPQIEWRLAEVRLGDAAPIAPDGEAMTMPLATYAPTAWFHLKVPAAAVPGRYAMRCVVAFAVRQSPGGAVVGRWTSAAEQTVEIVAPR